MARKGFSLERNDARDSREEPFKRKTTAGLTRLKKTVRKRQKKNLEDWTGINQRLSAVKWQREAFGSVEDWHMAKLGTSKMNWICSLVVVFVL